MILSDAMTAGIMVFTEKEEKLVKRLRKQDRQWRWGRWVFLGAGVISVANLALSGWILFHSANALSLPGHPDINDVLMVAIFFPKCLITMGLATFLLSIAWRDWNGNVNRMLLLKLLDAQQKRDEVDGRS